MKLETVPVSKLLPLEVALRFEKNIANMFNHFDERIFRPIPVVSYSQRGEVFFIMGDGHHRASYCYLAGKSAPIEIIETNLDIYMRHQGAFNSFERINDFVSAYEDFYRPNSGRWGVYSVEDLVLKQAECNPQGIVAEKLCLLRT